jgi:hypothetical protein
MRMRSLLRETRRNWVSSYANLLREIRVPTVLLWFSRRGWDYPVDHSSVEGVFGDFPQLIDRATMPRVIPHAAQYVECVSTRGDPQQLISRFTGQPASVRLGDDRPEFGDVRWTHNRYYPTPEMHADAADYLAVACAPYAQAAVLAGGA